jgi:PAS domain S-box-containing protein
MKKTDVSGFGITENIWLGSILSLSFVVITFTVWCLSHGITTMFPNLYYILIIIIAYHYRKTGFFLVLLISLAYLVLVILFTHDLLPLEEAIAHIIIFIIIGAMIAYLSETIVRSWDTIHAKSQIQQSIIQNANVLLVVLDSGGRILQWNTAAEEMSGYAAQEVVGKNDIWKYLYPDAAYRKTITGTITRVIGANNFFENFETVIRTKSGGQKTISWNTRAIPGEEGRPSGFVAIGIDVTARKKLEEELTSVAHGWESTFDATSDGICLIGADQKIQRCNRQMRMILGDIPMGQIVGRSCFEVVHETAGPIADCPFVTAKKTLRRTSSEVNLGNNWFEMTADPILDSTGTFTGIVHIMRDITERKQAVEALRESEKKYRTLFENMLEGFAYCRMIYDEIGMPSDWVYLDVNRAFEHLTGLKEITGKRVLEAIPDIRELSPELFDTYGRVASTGIPETFEIDFKPLGMWLRVSVFSPQKGYFVAAFEDITERKRAEEALRLSEEKFRDIFDMINDAIHIHEIGPDGRPGKFIEVNEVACRMLQYTREELLEHGPLDFVTGYHSRPTEEIFGELLSNGHAIFETEQRRKDGTIVPVEVNTHVVSLQGKRVVVAVVRDITERKRAEEALRDSRQILEGVLNAIPVRVFWKDKELTYLGCNTPFARDAGFERPEEVIGKDDYSMGWRDQAEIYRADDRAVIESGKPKLMIEEPQTTPAGETIYLLTNKMPLLDARGDTIGLLGTYLDITERKRAEKALHDSRQILEGVLNTIPARVFWKNKELTYLGCNTPFARDAGFERPEDVIGKDDYSMGWRDQAELYRADDRAVIESGKPKLMIEEPQTTPAGETIYILTSKMPLLDARGDTIGVLGTYLDITERKRAEEALRESEERYRILAEESPDQIFIIGRDDTMLYVNSAAMKLFRLPYDQIIGKPRKDLFPPQIYDALGLSLKKVFETGASVRTEETIQFGREELWIDTNLVPLKDKEGNVNSALGIARDITERKHMEQTLRESRQLFSDIISFLPDPTFVIDVKGNVLAWNRAIEQLSRVHAADIIGKGDHEYSLWQYGKRRPTLINLVQDPDQDYARAGYRGIIRDGQTVMAESDLIRSGKMISLSLVASPLVDAEGKIIGAIESMRDITRTKETEAELAHINAHLETLVKERTGELEEEVTQRRNAEQKVRDTLRHTRNVIEANPDLMVILDAQGIIRDVNATAEQMTGLPREKLIGTASNLYLTGDINAEKNFARLLHEGFLTDIAYDILHLDGRITPIISNTRVQRDEAGNVEYIITAAHDITQQKKDAEILKASLDEKITLLREVHHRVKNNLQIIISLNNLQLREIDDPQLKKFLNETKDRVRAMSLVHEKLYQSESLSHIDLADYLRFLSSQLFSSYRTDTRRVKLVLEIGKSTIDINLAIPLGLIVNELVSNALKYAFPGDRAGTLLISGGIEDHLLTISVKDDGIGMPPGYDWKNATSLGLRLVNILTEQIDGAIRVIEDQGTTFIITVRLKPYVGDQT